MDKSRLKQLLHPNWVSNVENFSIHCTTTNGFSSPTIFNFVTILFVRLLSMHMDFALFSAADTSIDGWHNGIKKNIFRILIQFVDVKERDQEKIIRKNRKRNTQINAFNEPFLCVHIEVIDCRPLNQFVSKMVIRNRLRSARVCIDTEENAKRAKTMTVRNYVMKKARTKNTE